MSWHEPGPVPNVEKREDVLVAIVRMPDGREFVEELPAGYGEMPGGPRFCLLADVFQDLLEEAKDAAA